MVELPAFLLALEETFNRAMVSNNVHLISACITADWLLITPESGPVAGSVILEAIRSGRLTHATMVKQPLHGGVVGDVAWVTGRGQNTGTFLGAPLQADEWITDVYRKEGGTWRCFLTHLTPAAR